MNLTPKQKAIAGIAALCLLLIITNPSVSAFKTYRGKNTYSGLKRPVNLFICSVYQDHYGDKYLALFGNFINITYHPEPVKVVAVTDKDPFAKYGGHEIDKDPYAEFGGHVIDSSIHTSADKKKYDFSSFDKAVKEK